MQVGEVQSLVRLSRGGHYTEDYFNASIRSFVHLDDKYIALNESF